VSLDQFETRTSRSFVPSIEKIDRDDGPRRNVLAFLEQPNVVVDVPKDEVRTIGVAIQRVSIYEAGHHARLDVDLSFVADDEIYVVRFQRAHTTPHDLGLMNDPIECRRVHVHLVTFGSGSKLVDETGKPIVRKPLACARSLDRRQLWISPCGEFQNSPRRRCIPGATHPLRSQAIDSRTVNHPTASHLLSVHLAGCEELAHTSCAHAKFESCVGHTQQGHI
jgi:hypothetical protein